MTHDDKRHGTTTLFAALDVKSGLVIGDYLLQHNAHPKPFVWSKTAEDILTRERRAFDALDEIRGNW